LAPETVFHPITITVPAGWSCYNPSIAADGGAFRMIIRSANYTFDHPSRYTPTDGSGIVRSTNYLADLSPEFAIDRVQIIDDRAFRPEPPPFPVAGFEDCRLFHHSGNWWVSASARDQNEKGISQIVMLRLAGADAVEMQLLSDGVQRYEKNWMPVPAGTDEKLRFVYTSRPTVILRYDDEAGAVVPEVIHDGPPIARSFRGGTQAVPFDGGRLCLIHEAAEFPDGSRVYMHRWVWFGADWLLARLSPPFVFFDRGIEFAVGLAARGDLLVVSFGRWEREAWLATVPMERVLAALAPPMDPEDAQLAPLDALINPQANGYETAGIGLAHEPVSEVGPAQAADGITPFNVQHRLVSVTLCGNSRDVIGDALRSVAHWVDRCLIIDTGITDDTLEVAHQVAGGKLVVRSFPWRDDFAAARNFALQAAAELGATWAVMLDTDERIDIGDVDVHAALQSTRVDLVYVHYAGGSYGKERFFRLPTSGQYVGPTHEAFIRGPAGWEELKGVRFTELGKTAEQYRKKAERDVAILARYCAEHPEDPRWFYYLGDSLAGLGRTEEAIVAFRACAGLHGWDEEGAWAMYRTAECLLRMDRPDEAIEACAAGLARHAGIAELPWLAGYASWQADRPAQAVYWARFAAAMGNFAGAGSSVPRVGFRYPFALWEGPYDILRFALRRLGDDAGADEAEGLVTQARAAREEAGG
jgi:tetratricopeptide (TPR) repeat protein